MSRPLVLVVDDDASVRRALARLLATAGYAVQTFASARAFLERENPDEPVCVVLDVRMPGQDGLDLYQTLVESGRDVSAIFITGHGDVPMAVRAMKAGAVDFLAKPFTEAALLAAIARVFPDGRTGEHVGEPEGIRPVA